MKKFLSALFALIFFGFLFTWNKEIADFWKNEENRDFIIREFLTWIKNYAYLYEGMTPFTLSLLALGGLLLILYFYRHTHKKQGEKMKKNPLIHKKPIMQGDAILSPGSLPEKESKTNRQTEKMGPFIPKEKIATNSKESNNKKDIDIDSMTSLLEKKE